jgi:hypothetical protein
MAYLLNRAALEKCLPIWRRESGSASRRRSLLPAFSRGRSDGMSNIRFSRQL